MKISDCFPKTMHYSFSKINEGIYATEGHHYREYSKIYLDDIFKYYKEFESELEKRGEIPANDSIKDELDNIFHALNKVKEFFSDVNTTLQPIDAYIFTFFIQKRHDEYIVDIAREIDDEYKSHE